MNNNAKKETLAEKLHFKIGISKEESKEIIDVFFKEIKLAIIEKQEVKLPLFGTFKVNFKKERIGRNPKTLEEKVITSRKVVSFSCSRKLKEHILNNID